MPWRPDPEAIAIDALAIDAFSMSRSAKFMHIFPPFSVISWVLQKLSEDADKAILVVPSWLTQSWFPTLCHLSFAEPLPLPRSRTLLRLPG